MGSSPQVRGARGRPATQPHTVGIIPAGAGSTRRAGARSNAWRDHPRRCGEHVRSGHDSSSTAGSSPQVRGAPRVAELAQEVRGIIPAGAGSTCRVASSPSGSKDHPRRCGEHAEDYADRLADEGSSPQVRGARTRSARRARSQGIIPAGAGSTSCCSSDVIRERDHPRRCGEHGCRTRR